MFSRDKSISVRDRGDYAPLTVTTERVTAWYNELSQNVGEELLCEAASLGELEHAYIGHELAHWQDQFMLIHPTGVAMFEAVSATKSTLIRVMRAFTRKLNTQMASSGITAGTEDATTAEDDSSAATAGGAEISPVRRVAGVPIVFARIPLSDGQSVTIAFHSPTAQTAQLAASDVLVAFRFLLNKRDITHTVAPQGGVDVSLSQATLTIAKLAERNSPKFAKTQSRAAQLKQSIADKISAAEQAEAQALTLQDQADKLSTEASTKANDLQKIQSSLDKQKDINAALQEELARLQAIQPEPVPTPTPEPTPVPEPEPVPPTPPAGDIHPGIKPPAEPAEVTPEEELSLNGFKYSDLYWYGVYQRPIGPGSVPNDSANPLRVSLNPEDAKQAPIVAQKNAPADRYAYGVIGYSSPLSAEDISHFSLFDFADLLTPAEADAQLQPLKDLIASYKGQNPEADSVAFFNTFMMPNSDRYSDLPIQFQLGESKAIRAYLSKLLFAVYGEVRGGIKTQIDMLFNSVAASTPEPELTPEPTPPAADQATIQGAMDVISRLAEEEYDTVEEAQAAQERLNDAAKILLDNGYGDNWSDDINAAQNQINSEIARLEEATKPAPTENTEVAQAINTLNAIIADNNANMDTLREYRKTIRAAYATFDANGTLADNEDLVNQAINHVGDLMAAIARSNR